MTTTATVDIMGGLSVMLSAGPNPGAGVQGEQSASVWNAELVAASALDKNLTDFTFTASPQIDDTSASALLAAGFIASITGATIDPAATLTGYLYPDGTLGPVDGIPEKFLAALESGKKRLGYPSGMRKARSADTGDLVDLEKLAADHGARAVPLGDVQDAYKLLTGEALPRPVPVPAADMALDAETTTLLDAQYKRWQQRLGTQWGAILQLESAGRLPERLATFRDTAKLFAAQAAEAYRGGQLAAAYARVSLAAVYAETANQAYALLAAVQDGKLDDAVAMLGREDVTQVRSALDAVAAQGATTLVGAVRMVAAFRAILRGSVAEFLPSRSIPAATAALASLKGKTPAELRSDAVADSVDANVMPALLTAKRIDAELALAREQLALQGAPPVALSASPSNIMRLASSFRAGATANLAHVDAVNTAAGSPKISFNEPAYRVASLAARVDIKSLGVTWGETSTSAALFMLAANELAYTNATELLVEYESLGAHVAKDDAGRVDSIEHADMLDAILASTERSARAAARAARVATGSIPVQVKVAYQNALADQHGTVDEKLFALGQFWAASAGARLAVMLARN
jgi:hypothetical protein